MKRMLPLVALALTTHVAIAQRGERPARLEIMAGANLAKFSGDGGTDNRTGLVAGIGLVKPLAPGWAFEPEVTYAMKGAKSSGSFAGTTSTATFKLNYIEIPLLFRYEFSGGSNVRPFINFGPAPAFKVSCDGEVKSGGTTVSGSCDDNNLDTKSFDIGLVGGAGLAFHHMRHTITVGGRFDYGLIDAFDNGDAKNRVWSIVGTIDFPWGSR